MQPNTDRDPTRQRSALPDCDGSTEVEYAKFPHIPKPGEIITLRIDAGDGQGPVHDTVPRPGLYVQRIDWEERLVYLDTQPPPSASGSQARLTNLTLPDEYRDEYLKAISPPIELVVYDPEVYETVVLTPKEKGPVGQVSTPLDGPVMKDWD
jgi:hypothetical protein